MPSITKDSAKRHSTKGVQSPSRVAGQSPGLTGLQQDSEDQQAKDSDLRRFAQVSAAPHTFVQRIHCAPVSCQLSINFYFAACRRVNHAAYVGKRLRDFHILNVHRNYFNGRIQDVTEHLDLGPDPRNSESYRLYFVAQRIECARNNFGCTREYNRVIRTVKISAPDNSGQQSTA